MHRSRLSLHKRVLPIDLTHLYQILAAKLESSLFPPIFFGIRVSALRDWYLTTLLYIELKQGDETLVSEYDVESQIIYAFKVL